MKKLFFFLSFFLLFTALLTAQKGELIAVPHIEASGTSEIEAETARSMLEIGLVKAGLYTVIANNDIETILEAQAFTLTGCTDDSCAIEIGKLLAADRIVLGELVSLGDQFILNIRLINVSTGRTEKAESISMDSLEGLQDASYQAAYALSNQKYVPGMESGISEFGELYVEAPDKGKHTVYIDGKYKGESPLLIQEVPFGVHLLQVKSDSLEYESEINVSTKKIQKIMADPDLLTGNLILSLNPDFLDDVKVYIDGTETGAGLLEDLKSGARFIYAVGDGWAGYDYIEIVTGKTASAELKLYNEIGTLTVSRDTEDADTLFKLTDSGGGVIPVTLNEAAVLPTGEYTFTITESDYETYRETVFLSNGDKISLTPELSYSRLFLLTQEREILNLELEKLSKRDRSSRGWFWTGTVIGGTGLAGAIISEIAIQLNIKNIEESTPLLEAAVTAEEAAEYGQSISNSINLIDPSLRILRNSSLITGGVGALIAGTALLTRPDLEDSKARLAELDKEISKEAVNE
ncbi:MAG: PEGA domain-containing protein [Spirochaetales bacterium]|uniref:PEGA domain-containing protein n=1 Tax=Candidatus Thalassospirochaeta sargassi TaxID=3119039 RepID=A0AAJ1IDB7_9SPIO|nr:PEGA domain-containing protein [Spirochaetales bacterium]